MGASVSWCEKEGVLPPVISSRRLHNKTSQHAPQAKQLLSSAADEGRRWWGAEVLKKKRHAAQQATVCCNLCSRTQATQPTSCVAAAICCCRAAAPKCSGRVRQCPSTSEKGRSQEKGRASSFSTRFIFLRHQSRRNSTEFIAVALAREIRPYRGVRRNEQAKLCRGVYEPAGSSVRFLTSSVDEGPLSALGHRSELADYRPRESQPESQDWSQARLLLSPRPGTPRALWSRALQADRRSGESSHCRLTPLPLAPRLSFQFRAPGSIWQPQRAVSTQTCLRESSMHRFVLGATAW